MGILQSKYALDQRVAVGADDTIIATVVAVSFRTTHAPIYEVVWVDRGEVKYAQLPESLLRPKDDT